MKSIKVDSLNAEKIRDALRLANGPATTHAYQSFGDIQSLADEATRRLVDLNIHVSNWNGAEFVSTSGGPVAKSYRYGRKGTKVTLVRHSGGWFLEGVESVTIWPEGGHSKLWISEQQRQMVLTKVNRLFGVLP